MAVGTNLYNVFRYLRKPYNPTEIPKRWSNATAYLLDKPKDEKQMRYQSNIDVLTMGILGRYHEAKERMEYQKNVMDLYGVNFSDMKYPWLSGYGQAISSYSNATLGSALQVSKNAPYLYVGSKLISRSREKKKGRNPQTNLDRW